LPSVEPPWWARSVKSAGQPISVALQQIQQHHCNDRSRSRQRTRRDPLQQPTDTSNNIEAILKSLSDSINSLRALQEKQMELMMMMLKQQQQQTQQQGQILNLLTAIHASKPHNDAAAHPSVERRRRIHEVA